MPDQFSWWKAGHGAGRGRLHSETTPFDEARPATPAAAAPPERTALGKFTVEGARLAAKRKRARVGRVGRKGYEADPEFAPWERWGKAWASHRRGELARLHGGEITAAVGAIIEDEGLCRARSRFAHMKYAISKDREWSKEARAESTEARQLAKDAWQLAALEGAARPPADGAVPVGFERVEESKP